MNLKPLSLSLRWREGETLRKTKKRSNFGGSEYNERESGQ